MFIVIFLIDPLSSHNPPTSLLPPSLTTDNGRTKPRPKAKAKGKAGSPEPEDHLCLLRASNGKKKISTVISAREVTRFQMVRVIHAIIY